MSRLQDVLIRGIRADQPNANLVSPGTVYVVIDEDFLQEQSDGLVWTQFGPDVGVLGPQPYLDLIENIPVDPPVDTARLYALDVNGFTAVEVADSNANVVRLASDNILVGKVAVVAGIARGQLVYISGAAGANPLLGLAKADAIVTMPTVGLALDPGANNAFIRVLVSGTIQKLNTAGFAEGDSLFVSPTIAGDATTVLPTAPAFAQRVGFVTRAHATQGEILVLTTGTDGPPRLHAPTHANGGTDAVSITTLAGYPGGTTTFLRADGTFVAPPTGGGGGLLGLRVITTLGAGTYTPTVGTASVVIELLGGGGGGGAVVSPTASNSAVARSGGSGGYIRHRLTANFSGAAYVVGAKGTGGVAGNNAGNNGANTTFTTTGGSPVVYTAGGGTGGNGSASSGTSLFIVGTVTGGVCTNGDVRIPGGNSRWGMVLTAGSAQTSGDGGDSVYGRGGTGVRTTGSNQSSAGTPATGFGAGGAGATACGTGAAAAGGDGTDGLLIIWEYA